MSHVFGWALLIAVVIGMLLTLGPLDQVADLERWPIGWIAAGWWTVFCVILAIGLFSLGVFEG